MNAVLPSWGYSYGYTYSNPYYVATTMPAYDYSQPIVINTYNQPSAEASADQAVADEPAQDSPQEDKTYNLFDQAREAFKRNDFKKALQLDEEAVAKESSDPVLHEFGALCLFALGDYTRTAAVLNSLLAVSPGMDWTTMSGLYSNGDVYTKHLRALEAYCREKPSDAAGQFVLAYHYMVLGYSKEAIDALEKVVMLQPQDAVAKRMLEAMKPAEEPTKTTAAKPATGAEAQPAETQPAEAKADDKAAATTDLVGKWQAKRNGDVFDLTIDEQGKFVWKATPKGKAPLTISGNMLATNDLLVMESPDQGSMVGRVTSGGADQFQFVSTGGPPDDKGLSFERVEENK